MPSFASNNRFTTPRVNNRGKKPEDLKKNQSKGAGDSEEMPNEWKSNAFSRFYFPYWRPFEDQLKEEAEDLGPVQREIDEYKHRHAVKFAQTSLEWAKETSKKRKVLKSASDDQFVPSRCIFNFNFTPSFRTNGNSQLAQSIRAYYRVVAEHEDKYILMACHTNLHGFHRGGLRFVEVNARTITDGFEKFSIVGKLFLGDIVAVTKLSKKSKDPLDPPKALKMNPDSTMIWEVAKMRVLERKLRDRTVFAFMKCGSAIVKGRNEAATVKLNNNERIDLESIYTGSAFIPTKLFSRFSYDYKEGVKLKLLEYSSRFSSCPNALATIYKYEKCPCLTKEFNIGKDAFKKLEKCDAEEITELCTQMGQSAVLTLSDGRADSRMFPMLNPVKEEEGVKFSISNPLKYPTEGLWNCSNRIRFEGVCGKIDATIETVIPEENFLKIYARVSKESLKKLNFLEGTFVVYQREARDAVMLEDGYLRKMYSYQKGRRIIETLYGGPTLKAESLNTGPGSRCIFPSNPPILLNEYQNHYVSTMTSSLNPILLGSSPFGCGKSMAIVTAAIEKYRIDMFSSSQQFLITQSNYASVNLIDIARKVPESRMKIMRYVTELNWKELPMHCRTEYDLPEIMKKIFKQLAHGEIGNRDSTSTKEKTIILAYLVLKKELEKDSLSKPYESLYDNIKHDIKDFPIHRRTREAFEILLRFYNPNLIMITADTLQSMMSCSVYFNNVVMIQIDEACQLPECTLISLLRLFPNANYGLIGDIKQLPPFCEDELKGKLKEYGIGNTMERAIEEKMFPEAILRYVYRCHPKITELLSELFYDGNLISGVKEDQRNEFMRRRPDFWPNPHYPIILVHNRDKAYKIGTSCGNRAEKILAKQIVADLLKEKDGYQLKPSDIGVISFYAGQTAVLSDSFRGTGVKCGTVDAFQGSEKEVIILCCTNERISEARQATIIIGNSIGLSEAKYWKDIVKKVEENGGVVDTTKYPFHVDPEALLKSKKKKSEDAEKSKEAEAEKAGKMDEKQDSGRRGRDRNQKDSSSKPNEASSQNVPKTEAQISVSKSTDQTKKVMNQAQDKPQQNLEKADEPVPKVENAPRKRNRGSHRRRQKGPKSDGDGLKKLSGEMEAMKLKQDTVAEKKAEQPPIDDANKPRGGWRRRRGARRNDLRDNKNDTENKTTEAGPVVVKPTSNPKKKRYWRFSNKNDGEIKRKTSD
ncbi:hypothetical protein B9Z55_012886 [Caenorhabditis nigoni]|uniref:DNA2/NAM7 helicase-like C-terminal domain-containing protein n=1 Tax=Caenorhabditis nigoni TaxID=1611254 RepID=A0A2G5TZB2_9PELO|nr:hypothetical protein B9Z55_012886 [Caenorhabditis nigoni]